jgi:hypothetical protein
MPKTSQPLLELSEELKQRLPELSWKIKNLDPFWFNQSLPKHIFRSSVRSAEYCISEIELDLQVLSQQKNHQACHYLAKQIEQKINVLVGLCRIRNESEPKQQTFLGVTQLSTRQQWLQSLESELEVLAQQRQALTATLHHMTKSKKQEPASVLNLKSELGALEKRFTLAQEVFNKAINLTGNEGRT